MWDLLIFLVGSVLQGYALLHLYCPNVTSESPSSTLKRVRQDTRAAMERRNVIIPGEGWRMEEGTSNAAGAVTRVLAIYSYGHVGRFPAPTNPYHHISYFPPPLVGAISKSYGFGRSG
ncbi:hypothetical protein V496_05268 [Pseudogymnoascus sp. VKM F-4515 (FW-2607)]|nr:hypothetical protein V496_05268 [Pseudogymnoascus sp. VKM F-4515 (FW-2607)]